MIKNDGPYFELELTPFKSFTVKRKSTALNGDVWYLIEHEGKQVGLSKEVAAQLARYLQGSND